VNSRQQFREQCQTIVAHCFVFCHHHDAVEKLIDYFSKPGNGLQGFLILPCAFLGFALLWRRREPRNTVRVRRRFRTALDSPGEPSPAATLAFSSILRIRLKETASGSKFFDLRMAFSATRRFWGVH